MNKATEKMRSEILSQVNAEMVIIEKDLFSDSRADTGKNIEEFRK